MSVKTKAVISIVLNTLMTLITIGIVISYFFTKNLKGGKLPWLITDLTAEAQEKAAKRFALFVLTEWNTSITKM